MGKSINQEIISILESQGVNPEFVNDYKTKVPQDVNDITYLGNWWAQHISGLYLINRKVTSLCIYLRDTQTRPSWLDRFQREVTPLMCEVYNGKPQSIY